MTPGSPQCGWWCGAGSCGDGPLGTPSTLTVNVWSEMSATPRTAGPVLKSVDRPPTDSAMVLCAGQYRSGTHCTTSLSSHSNLPVIEGVDLTSTARSAARRLTTGARNVTTMGCATPTTWPVDGRTEATAALSDWCDAVRLMPDGSVATDVAIPTTTTTDRKTVRIRHPSSRQVCSSDLSGVRNVGSLRA